MAKILIAEDNELNRDMMARRLSRRGFEIILATDGLECLALARSEHPDLVMMDMSLPLLDGFEAARQLKATPETQDIPILALTAHAMAGDRQKCLDAGCDEYETKPTDFPRLLDKIAALLH